MSPNATEDSGTSTSTDVDSARKYHLLMELGRGGTAVVSAGIARGIGGFSKLVVLKNIKEDFLTDRETVKMFVNEARLSARMNHPNVVQVYEVYRQNKLPVIVMEYLDGQSLAKIQGRAFDSALYTTDLAVGILVKVLSGLEYAHTLSDYDGAPLQIVHRDVSPHNVVLTYDGQVKLVDFGIAKLSSSTEDTKTGVIKGKIGYMAPEQLEGDVLDRRGDVFAVGVMLWEAIARRRLWGARSDAEIVRCLVFDDIPSLCAVHPDVDPELERICKKALATQPDLRYSSAAEFQGELEDFLSKRNVSIRQQDIAELVCKTCEDLRAASQERLKAELAKFAAKAPGWDDALQAFDKIRTPLPESTDKPARRRGKGWMLLSSALLAAGTAAIVYAWVASAADPAPTVAAEAARPPQPAPLPPLTAPANVTLRVSVTPDDAAVFLDGRRLGSPVAETLQKDDREHELRAEASGFETGSQRIRLSSDLDLKLRLKELQAPVVAPELDGRKAPVRQSVRPRPRPPAPALPTPPPTKPSPPVASCNPPYYIGPDGLKHYRRECM